MTLRGLYAFLYVPLLVALYIASGGSCDVPEANDSTTEVASQATPTFESCDMRRLKPPDRDRLDDLVLPLAELRYGIELDRCGYTAEAAAAFVRTAVDADRVDDVPAQTEALHRHAVMLASQGRPEEAKALLWEALGLNEAYALHFYAWLDIQELEKLYLNKPLPLEDIPILKDLTTRKTAVEKALGLQVLAQLKEKQRLYSTAAVPVTPGNGSN